MVHTLASVFIVPILFLMTCSAESSSATLERIIAKAQERRLADSAQWRSLLHYAPQFISPMSPTRIRADSFFLADHGKSNAEAELQATLSGFLSPPPHDVNEHPQCRFPARWQWLNAELNLVSLGVQPIECGRYQEWRAALGVRGISLIFPASFLNNPASAFGHTFIRLDQAQGVERIDLLAYAADFAAQTHGEDALSYAAKGVFGGFDGYYTVGPFHKKVDLYSDLEHRDIWEYQLGLTAIEIELLVAHLWELRDIPVTYYYFDENCSYHILAILDVARPSLKLVESSRTWVLPVDTVRSVVDRLGLVQSHTFRPSAATTLRMRADQTDPVLSRRARDIARGADIKHSLDTLSRQEQARVLDVAYEYNTYERIRNRLSDDSKERAIAFTILKERSRLPAGEALSGTRPSVRPDQGHSTSLISAGIGRFQDKTFSDLQIRPALHALSDRPDGYLLGNQIKFMDTVIRWQEEQGVQLQSLTGIDITALTPRDDFFSPVSWRIAVQGGRYRVRDGDLPFVYSINGGAGYTYELTPGIIAFGLAEANFTVGADFEDENFVQVGPHVGAVYAANSWFGLEAHALYAPSVFGDDVVQREMRVSPRVSLSRDQAIRVDVQYENRYSTESWSYLVRFEHFFSPY